MAKRIITEEDITEITNIIYSVIQDILKNIITADKDAIQAKLDRVKERVVIKEEI